jgi:WD40 repeat protein
MTAFAASVLLADVPAWGQRPPVIWMRGGHSYGGITPLFSSDGQTMVSGGYDNTIKVWRLSDNILLRTINPFDVGPYEGSLSIAPNGLWMAAIGQDNDGYKLKVFHTADGSVVASYMLAGRPYHTAFSPDSQTVVADSAFVNSSPTPVTFYPAAGGTPCR